MMSFFESPSIYIYIDFRKYKYIKLEGFVLSMKATYICQSNFCYTFEINVLQNSIV